MNKMNTIKKPACLIIRGMIMILLSIVISCAGNKNSVSNIKEIKPDISENKADETDISGIYKLTDAEVCNIVITIKKHKNDYTYTLNGTGVKSSGKLSVKNDNTETYLIFTGTKRGGDNTPVEGACTEKKIIIQNYGNSMNQYVCFKSCDLKYLEFFKAE